MDYGVASKYEFDDPSKWYTVPAVPLLDEHQMTDESGRPVAYVDKSVLQVIADNNNRRVVETGDPATLILGHTSDDDTVPEKPAKGFVVNYRVLPYKRDPKTGQVTYAIHGDFKVRPKNTYILEEYPRRSVELWWNKKELDPIALLGGTSPERDLGVVIRKGRLKHISLLGGTTPDRDLSIHFSRRGDDSFESYPIDHVMRLKRKESSPKKGKGGKVEKVMHEFKEGSLRSGSKKGPKVTSRKQAIAIAMSEAGLSRKNSRSHSMPKRYEHCPPDDDESMKYDDDSMETDDIDNPNNPQDGPDADPGIARIFQSKQFRQLLQDAVSAALEQVMGGPEEGMEGGMGEGPPEPPMGGEGPPPEEGEGGPPMGGEGGGPDEEEDRLHHGEHPIQFEGPPTAMPGPGNTSIPSFANKGRRPSPVTSYSRNGSHMGNNKDQHIKQLEKKLEDLRMRLSRSDARELVFQLKEEGIEFGDTPESRVAGEKDEIEYLAMLNPEEQKYHVNEVIRKRYRRRKPNPQSPVMPGVARFARAEVRNGEMVDNPDDFSPQDPQEASDYADMLAVRKLSRVDAAKEMLKLRRQRDS